MVDEITLEDIFEIGERLLLEGADPSAVACARGVLEWVNERYGFLPHTKVTATNSVSIDFKVENYYFQEFIVKRNTGKERQQQIIGWSTYKGKVDKKEDGEVYYEAGESWYRDLEEFLTRRTRRHYRRGVVG